MRGSYRRSPVPAALTLFIAVVALAGVSFSAALVWQNAQDSAILSGESSGVSEITPEDLLENPSENSEREPESPAAKPAYAKTGSPSMADANNGRIKTASEAAQAVSMQHDLSGDGAQGSQDGDGTEKAAEYTRKSVDGAVPPSAPLGYDYFDDAIFFGDSLSVGIPLYMGTVVPNAAVIAMTGVSPGGANSSPCIEVNGTRVTMLEAAKAKGERKKVYIMLGANALDLDEESFIDGYREFVSSVKQMYPGAVIYAQSMLPVTEAVNKVYPSENINNGRIRQYNDAIRLMAKEQGVYYLDVAQCMEDASGFLPMSASPLDGMHLTPEYYKKWFDYLRSHTVKK